MLRIVGQRTWSCAGKKKEKRDKATRRYPDLTLNSFVERKGKGAIWLVNNPWSTTPTRLLEFSHRKAVAYIEIKKRCAAKEI